MIARAFAVTDAVALAGLTVKRNAALSSDWVADILSAYILIVTTDHGIVDASTGGDAAVVGARIKIIAAYVCALACPVVAQIGLCTSIAVIACYCVIGMDAAGNRIAAVIGTDVPIIAVGRCSTYASSAGAGIGCSTGVVVVAWNCVIGMEAPRSWVAPVISADVIVIAVGSWSAYATATNAFFLSVTDVKIIAHVIVAAICRYARSRTAHQLARYVQFLSWFA